MTKKIMLGIILAGSIMTMNAVSSVRNPLSVLPQPSSQLTIYHEIAVSCNAGMVELYNNLTPQERIFIYYLHRALITGNRIAVQQIHRHALEIQEMCALILKNGRTVRGLAVAGLDMEQFLDELTTYAVYIWTNHSQYFHKEMSHEKRTPARLGLTTLTADHFVTVLNHLNVADAEAKINNLASSLFETTVEPTLTVPGSIEESAVNMYAPGFTTADYAALSPADKSAINASFSVVVDTAGNRVPRAHYYRVGELFGPELEVVCHWLTKAHEIAAANPAQFDDNLTRSIALLIEFFKTGDEETFRDHCKVWLTSNSAIDMCYGFIEVYQDPQAYRGSWQADITVKSINLEKLNALLPSLEAQLPFPDKFKRDLTSGKTMIPNASINTVMFAGGGLGPIKTTAAYCLPNYDDIRAEGSKQIMYELDKGLGELINKERSIALSYLQAEADWARANDPEFTLGKDLWKLHCILHETVGHGSGKLAQHTFREGDPMTIDGVTYAVGQTIDLTPRNLPQFLEGYDSALEELRAEIMALYISVYNFDELAAAGFYGEWPSKMSRVELIDASIIDMANTAINRYLQQAVDATEITGAHARANCTLTHYLLDGRGLELREEKRIIDDTTYTVLGCVIADRDAVVANIKTLAQLVQQIKSTGDTQGVRALIDRYGKKPIKQEYFAVVRRNNEAVVGKLRAHALLFPHLLPIYDARGTTVIDIAASWPHDIVEQNLHHAELALSKE